MLFFAGVAEEAMAFKLYSSKDGKNEPLVVVAEEATGEYNNIGAYNDDCKCIKHNCECCKRLEWDAISMYGKVCANTTYLENDGISLSMTYDNFTIYNNKTVSALYSPPICFRGDIIDAVDVEVCLHIDIYGINSKSDKCQICFGITGRLMKLISTISKIKLGCIQTESCEIKNKLSPFKVNLSSIKVT
ncbi:Uncharacterized protein DBV15_01483 [Temnothorax longispinosus]|uniref:DUF4773 domain-containing protein n=1 Tax=Temnothorax longispinosus TaxID=300112 RepID=A0A4V3SBL1_9HYME|nr:Uncharacterized protein DBV15_01483 [Temnothorax longispinosus]